MTLLILFLLFVASFAAYAIAPFFNQDFRNKKIPLDRNERENLSYRKEEILASINDLEYDYTMKKMAESDYLQQKEKLTQEAIETMKKWDEMEGPENQNAIHSPGNKTSKVRS